MDIDTEEKAKPFAKIFFNKIINELNDEIGKTSLADFLKKKALTVPNEKAEMVYGGIILNIIFAVEYILKIYNGEDGLGRIKSIIKKLEENQSETDKMLSFVIETEIVLAREHCLAIFQTECFNAFIDLLEIETKINLKETLSEMLSGIMGYFLEIKNNTSCFNPPPFLEFLLKNTTLN